MYQAAHQTITSLNEKAATQQKSCLWEIMSHCCLMTAKNIDALWKNNDDSWNIPDTLQTQTTAARASLLFITKQNLLRIQVVKE